MGGNWSKPKKDRRCTVEGCNEIHNAKGLCYSHYSQLPEIRLRNRELSLMGSFGITLDQYNKMFINQKGCCMVCNTHQSSLKRSLSVDHNHTTGEVRGLLCQYCNALIGMAKESTEVLQRAMKYLEKHHGRLIPVSNS